MIVAVRDEFREDNTQRRYRIEVEHHLGAVTGQRNGRVRNALDLCETTAQGHRVSAEIGRAGYSIAEQVIVHLRQSRELGARLP